MDYFILDDFGIPFVIKRDKIDYFREAFIVICWKNVQETIICIFDIF